MLAGRPEIAIAGRVFTENVGIERMVQNIVAHATLRFLIVCGRESRHRVGQTILALHQAGLDAGSRVVGSEAPEPIMPNQVNEYVIDLHGNNHRFLKGHKIMVQVQSTWFPVIDRNPQKFVENIFHAKDSDYQAATQHVFRSKSFPSHLKLPVVTR